MKLIVRCSLRLRGISNGVQLSYLFPVLYSSRHFSADNHSVQDELNHVWTLDARGAAKAPPFPVCLEGYVSQQIMSGPESKM